MCKNCVNATLLNNHKWSKLFYQGFLFSFSHFLFYFSAICLRRQLTNYCNIYQNNRYIRILQKLIINQRQRKKFYKLKRKQLERLRTNNVNWLLRNYKQDVALTQRCVLDEPDCDEIFITRHSWWIAISIGRLGRLKEKLEFKALVRDVIRYGRISIISVFQLQIMVVVKRR